VSNERADNTSRQTRETERQRPWTIPIARILYGPSTHLAALSGKCVVQDSTSVPSRIEDKVYRESFRLSSIFSEKHRSRTTTRTGTSSGLQSVFIATRFVRRSASQSGLRDIVLYYCFKHHEFGGGEPGRYCGSYRWFETPD